MLLDRYSLYEVVYHIRDLKVKVTLKIEHKINYMNYNKDGEYKISIKKIEYLDSNNKPSKEKIYETVMLSFEKFKPNFTAVSAKEITL